MFLGSLSKEPIQEGYQIVYSCEEVGEYSESIKDTKYLILSEEKKTDLKHLTWRFMVFTGQEGYKCVIIFFLWDEEEQK